MWNRFSPLFLSIFLLSIVGCSGDLGDQETGSELKVVQAAYAPALNPEEEPKEEAGEEIGEETGEEIGFPMGREIYLYESGDRRDPFVPLIAAEGEALPGDERRINVENLSLVGVLWGDRQKVAVLSDQTGNGYVFKEGDSLPRGKVVSISERSIVFELSQFGIVTKYEIVMEE